MGEHHHACSDAAFLSRLQVFELIPHIARALADGRAAALGEIAATADVPVADVERLLRSQPGTEWSDDGRLVGFGLTQRPTAHQFTVEGKELYTWCATDTLVFTVILGCPTLVESVCPATGEMIGIELAPDAVASVMPEDAVVSQRHHGEMPTDVRADVCNVGHYFASPAAATVWVADHPDGEVVGVRRAFDQSRAACAELGWIPAVTNR